MVTAAVGPFLELAHIYPSHSEPVRTPAFETRRKMKLRREEKRASRGTRLLLNPKAPLLWALSFYVFCLPPAALGSKCFLVLCLFGYSLGAAYTARAPRNSRAFSAVPGGLQRADDTHNSSFHICSRSLSFLLLAPPPPPPSGPPSSIFKNK